MQRKYFPRDKNYILEKAQLSVREPLLQYLVDFVKVEYLLRFNPLGLRDATSDKITQHQSTDSEHLSEFYLTLAGIFRFKFYRDNQLEFGFDGRDEFTKYQEEWTIEFKRWAKDLCRQESFIRAILELTVFYPEDYTPQMAGLRLGYFVSKFFEVKIDATRGIQKLA